MTEFELSLAQALRDEAEEIAMHTDQQLAAEELQIRFDRADRANRRRHMWYAASVVAVAALVVAAVVVFSRQASRTDGVGPTTPDKPGAGVAYAATFMQPPLHVELPSWTKHANEDQQGTAVVIEEQPGCANATNPCPDDADLKLRLLTLRYFYRVGEPTILQNPSYSEVVAAWEAMGTLGFASILDESSVTVGGRPATVMSLEVLREAPGSIACPFKEMPADGCPGVSAGRAVRMAVVDQAEVGLPPAFFYLSMNGDAPDRADRFAEFDAMLDTVAFD